MSKVKHFASNVKIWKGHFVVQSHVVVKMFNIKCENVNMPNLRCQMSKYQMSGHCGVNGQNFEEIPPLWHFYYRRSVWSNNENKLNDCDCSLKVHAQNHVWTGRDWPTCSDAWLRLVPNGLVLPRPDEARRGKTAVTVRRLASLTPACSDHSWQDVTSRGKMGLVGTSQAYTGRDGSWPVRSIRTRHIPSRRMCALHAPLR